ncbi:hypothetical protein MUP07_00675 [Candidatus Bathyarchaeota archaeon]|nr:hypothetical protein [Candidatus Bathyarchaeota archaeon]
MKLKTDLGGELEVPKRFEEAFRKWCDGEAPTSSDDLKSWFADFYYDNLADFDGKVVPKEEARFHVNFATCDIPGGGGYPVDREISFTDRGVRYTVIAFAWTSELDDKGPLSIVAYKEPKKRRKK